MLIQVKNTPARKALAITLRYQRKYPEIIGKQRIPGRISLQKRIDHIKEVADSVIKDRTLVKILMGEYVTTKSRNFQDVLQDHQLVSTRIASHCLSKTGSAEGALKMLQEIHTHLSEMIPEGNEIIRAGKITKLDESGQSKFNKQIGHQIRTALALLLSPIDGAIRLLQKP